MTLKSIGFVAINKQTNEPYTGGSYSSGAKVFRTYGHAQGAINRHVNAYIQTTNYSRNNTFEQLNKNKQFNIVEVFIREEN